MSFCSFAAVTIRGKKCVCEQMREQWRRNCKGACVRRKLSRVQLSSGVEWGGGREILREPARQEGCPILLCLGWLWWSFPKQILMSWLLVTHETKGRQIA